jgi:membrane-bound ClpP family serine protease
MWVVAGVLLGIVVLASIGGFHLGPHSHAVAGAVGVLAAAWLIIMAFTGYSAPLLWTLLSADVVVTGGVGVIAWKALTTPAAPLAMTSGPADGAEGVALTDLTPQGTVRVRGETWSATSVNGTVRAGTPIAVIDIEGVHLRVWGEKIEETEEIIAADPKGQS